MPTRKSEDNLLICLFKCEIPPKEPLDKTDAESSVVEQPFKIPFVAATVIVIDPQKPEVTQELLTGAAKAIQEYLEAGRWREVKLVLRFLACLQGLLEEDGVFPVLEELFSRAVDLQTASSEDVSFCQYCYCYSQS